MKTLIRCATAAAFAAAFGVSALAADLKVGLSVSLSGPNSSLGMPYAKGMQAALAYKARGQRPQGPARSCSTTAPTRPRPAATRASWSRRTRSTC